MVIDHIKEKLCGSVESQDSVDQSLLKGLATLSTHRGCLFSTGLVDPFVPECFVVNGA